MPYGHIHFTEVTNGILVYENNLYKMKMTLSNSWIKGRGKGNYSKLV